MTTTTPTTPTTPTTTPLLVPHTPLYTIEWEMGPYHLGCLVLIICALVALLIVFVSLVFA